LDWIVFRAVEAIGPQGIIAAPSKMRGIFPFPFDKLRVRMTGLMRSE